MSGNESAQSPLLAQSDAHPSPVSSTSNEPNTTDAARPTLSQWAILRFIIATPMSCSRWIAFLYVVIGAGSSAGSGIALAYYASYTGQLNLAAKNKDGPSYDDAISKIIFVIVGTMLSQGVSTYCMKRIGIMKRVHLNRTLHHDYFRSKNFYVINAFSSDEFDSIDSRLTSDIHTMTSEFFSILQVVLYCIAAIVQGVVLILGENATTLSMIGLACLVLFSFIVAILLKVISARVSSRVGDLKRDEGSFSFQHTRIKKNCESIAFYSGQSLELKKIKDMFETVLRSSRNLVKWQMILDFLSFVNNTAINNSFPQWIGNIPLPITCRLFSLDGSLFSAFGNRDGCCSGCLCYLRLSTSNKREDQRIVSDAYQLYNSLLSQTFQRFVTIAAVAGPLSASIGCGARVLYLKRRLDDMHASAATPPRNPARGSEFYSLPTLSGDTSVVQLSNICVRVPHSARELVTGLSISIPGNVLLMGPSGCGKSSVLRVIAGLWPAEGHIKAPAVGRSGICFLTQRPYMCPVSLRQNVSYPSQDFLSDGDLKRLLGMSGLSQLFDRTSNFDEVLDWANILSLGEQQRIAFARCFHMMPRVVILDESTSALDPDNEEHLYQTLRSLKINFISVGHRSQLKAYHDQLVVLDGQGHFSSSLIQAIPVPLPPANDTLQEPDMSAKSTSLAVTETANATEVLKTPMSRFRHLFGILFLRKVSAKNLMVHFLLVLLFVADNCSVLYETPIVFARGILYFEDTSLNDILSFIFILVVVAALVQTIINALIAYVSIRTRKNLCREMHKLYFEENT
jgi:putative ATP-binding cassette transporter